LRFKARRRTIRPQKQLQPESKILTRNFLIYNIFRDDTIPPLIYDIKYAQEVIIRCGQKKRKYKKSSTIATRKELDA
jgi:hypothetical protein